MEPNEDGSVKTPEAPDPGVETPATPAGQIPIAPAPGEPTGDHAPTTIMIDGKPYTPKDLSAIIGIKGSLETENKDLKGKVRTIEEADLNAVELANKRAVEAEDLAAKRLKKLLIEKAQRLLDAKLGAGKVNAAYINLGVESEEEVAGAVDQFIATSPALTPGAGSEEPHVDVIPGAAVPGGAPQNTTKEAQLLKDLEDATTEPELEKARKAYDLWRNKGAANTRRII